MYSTAASAAFVGNAQRKQVLTGWAANDTVCDNRVILKVQGDEPQLNKFFFLLDKGNDCSRIDSIDKTIIYIEPTEKGFQAKRSLN